MTAGQLSLWEDEPAAPDVLWFTPYDRYGRDLPPIAVMPGERWWAATCWTHAAVAEADRLGPDATLQELFDATTLARHTYYALTGDRARLEAELSHYAGRPVELASYAGLASEPVPSSCGGE